MEAQVPATPAVKKVIRRKNVPQTPTTESVSVVEPPPAPVKVKKPRATTKKATTIDVSENERITEPEPEVEPKQVKRKPTKKTPLTGSGSGSVGRRTPKKMISVKSVYRMCVQEDKTKYLMGILKMASEHVGEGNLYIYPQGIYFQGMDSSHVSVLEFNLHQSWFSEYESTTSVRVIGVSFKILANVLSCYSKADSIALYGAEGIEEEKLSVSIREKDNIHHFQIPLMSVDTELLGIPLQEHTLRIHLPVENVKSSCDRLEKLDIEAPELVYEINSTEADSETETETEAVLTMKGSGTNGLSANITMTTLTPEMEGFIHREIPLRTSIALRFIKAYLNQSSIFKTCTIEITEGLPVVFTSELGDSIPEISTEFLIVNSGAGDAEAEPEAGEEYFHRKNIVRIFIAPRVEDDS
jgi:hypothetical protein